MEKVTIKVSGMSCSHCEKRVRDALLSVDGVKDAKASVKKGTAVVKHDGADYGKMVEAVKQAGYEAE